MPIAAIRRFLKLEIAGGITLMVAAALAVVCANAPVVSGWYQQFLEVPILIHVGPLKLDKDVLLFINDGLMAIFFLLIGLEVKREMLEGELSSVRQVALPGVAALGGVAIPALIYSLINSGDEIAMRGWAIPAATDIAFSLAVLAMLGSRAPLSLKVFLTAVAVVDDLAAIVIIALFYTENLSVVALGCAGGGLAVLILLNRFGVRSYAAYVIVGVIMWVCVLKSGIHATLAGVAVGFTIPHRVKHADGTPMSVHLEHVLHPWVAFMILPMFAFANSGISFTGMSFGALFEAIPLGIAAGLVLGKPVGVTLSVVVAVKTGLAELPNGATWKTIIGVGLLCGIGFTMSLFIGMLAFAGEGAQYGVATRLGVFGGSLLAAFLGFIALRMTLPRVPTTA